jgi:hypothetical protein
MFRRLTVRVVVPAVTAAAIVAPGASAMPMEDTPTRAAKMDRVERSQARVDAAAHAATMRAIGARLTASEC